MTGSRGSELTTRRRWIALFGLVAALGAGALTGCSADPDGQAGRTPSGSASEPAAEAEPTFAPIGPLEEVLGYDLSFGSAADVAADIAWRENQVAQCMKEQGFEYWPMVPGAESITFHAGPLPGSREFVEAYGFGISTQETGGAGWTFSGTQAPEQLAYLEGMSAAETEAYNTALYGPVTDDPASDDQGVYRAGGCAVPSNEGASDDGLDLIRSEANAFLMGLANHSALDDLNREWSACMADSGYTEASPSSLKARLDAEFMELSAGGGPGGSALEPDSELVETEMILALADLECREKLDYDARSLEIRHTLQQDYLTANQADLDRLQQAIEEAAA